MSRCSFNIRSIFWVTTWNPAAPVMIYFTILCYFIWCYGQVTLFNFFINLCIIPLLVVFTLYKLPRVESLSNKFLASIVICSWPQKDHPSHSKSVIL